MSQILFISSEAATRDWWVRSLRSHGREALALPPGIEAFTKATGPIEAAIVDIDLASDWQCCRVLSAQHLTAPLIAMTSWSAPDGRCRRLAFRAGCQAIVAKPCSVDALLGVIERLASGETHIEVSGSG
jgi:CheY-like chemotaxis protein